MAVAGKHWLSVYWMNLVESSHLESDEVGLRFPGIQIGMEPGVGVWIHQYLLNVPLICFLSFLWN